MKIIRLLSLLATFAIAAPLYAQTIAPLDSDEAFFKDYIGITKLLRTQGVDPVNIRWNEVESMCLSLQDPYDPHVYNHCRYEKALDQFMFRDDANNCDREAAAINPNPQQNIIQQNGAIIANPGVNQDPQAIRRYNYDHCMTEKGWRSPDNYQLGHTH